MKLFIAPNSAVTFDSAMGYKKSCNLLVAALFVFHQMTADTYNKKTPAEAGVFKNQKPKFMKPFTCSRFHDHRS